jgi:hypothetical protein
MYSEEELIEELQRVSEEHCDGEAPKTTDMNEYSDIHYQTYCQRFDSWEKAKKEAGFLDFYAEGFAEDIQNVSDKHCNGNAPTWQDMEKHGHRHPETYTLRHDCTWNEVLEKAGFEATRPITKEEFFDKVSKYYSKRKKIPTRKEMERELEHFPNYYQRWNLSWKEVLLESTGLSPEEIESFYIRYSHYSHYSKEDIDERLEQYDNTPTLPEFLQETGISPSPIKNTYGSWTNALIANGFEPNKIPVDQTSEQEIVEELRKMSENSLPPTLTEFRERSKYTMHHINHYGGWKELLTEAGFQYNARYSGENNHNWEGGEFRYYGPYWVERREEVVERDGNKCRLCGETENIHVHHITPARLFGEDYQSMNETSNLVCLCRECHNDWEGRFIGCDHDEFIEKCRKAQRREDSMSLFEY